jgi:hypothetical protein
MVGKGGQFYGNNLSHPQLNRWEDKMKTYRYRDGAIRETRQHETNVLLEGMREVCKALEIISSQIQNLYESFQLVRPPDKAGDADVGRNFMDNHETRQAFYSLWRLTMWRKGYGSYRDIDNAVVRGELVPGEDYPDKSSQPDVHPSEKAGG